MQTQKRPSQRTKLLVNKIQSANNGCHHHIAEATEVSDELLVGGDGKIQVPSSVNLSNLSLSLRVKQSLFVVRFPSLFFFFFEAEIWKKILEPSSSTYMLTKGELHHTCF